MRFDDVNVPDRRRVTEAVPRLRWWWKETVIVSVFYGLYSAIRNRFGSFHLATGGVPLAPFRHALQVVRFEGAIGLYRERGIQQSFLGHHRFLQFWNVFYGTAHFVVTIATFMCLYRFLRARFVRWHNTLACTTALALVGFMLYPLMPPRLLNSRGLDGGASLAATVNQNGPAKCSDLAERRSLVGGSKVATWHLEKGSGR